ncbi:MAG: PAS domain S-box protein, partial [Planctomycetota bacterium]
MTEIRSDSRASDDGRPERSASDAERRAWLSEAFERSPDPMAVTDLEGNMLYANPAAYALDESVGYELRTGGPALLFGEGRVDDAVRGRLLACVRAGERFEERVRVSAGGVGDRRALRWLHVSLSPLTTDGGIVRGAMIIKRDVTSAVDADSRARTLAEGSETRARIAEILADELPLCDSFDRAVRVLVGTTCFGVIGSGGVVLPDGPGGSTRVCAWVESSCEKNGGHALRDGECARLWDEASRSGRVVVSGGGGEPGDRAGWRGGYAVPLVHRSVCLGVLVLRTDADPPRAWEVVETLERIGELFASAIIRDRQEAALAAGRAEAGRLAERLRVATEEARIGIWEYEPRTDTLEWDGRMYELYGRDPETTPTYGVWATALHPEDRERAEGEFALALAGDGSFNTMFRIIDPEGRQRYLRGTATVLRDDAGRVTRVIGSNWDVTESQVTLERLNESQRIARMGSWSLNVSTGEVEWSRELYRMFGVDPAGGPPDLESALACYDDEGRERLRPAVLRAMTVGESYSMVLRLRDVTRGATWIRCDGRARRDSSGRVCEIFGTATDVTDEVQYRSSIAALDSTNDCIFMIDPETLLFVYANHGAMAQVGYGMDELSRMKPYEINPELDADSFRAMLEPLRDDPGRSQILRTVHEHRDGTLIPVEVSLQLAGGESGAARFVAVVRDIGEQLANETRLMEARDRAEAASRAKSDFLANMSHEIRTPMTAILGYSDMIAGGRTECRAELSDAVRKIRSNADHLLTVINDILDVSKIEAGQMTVEIIGTDAAALVRDVLELVAPRARAKGVAVGVEFLTPVPERIESDPTRLRQILLNLVSNAIKFTDEGRVDVRVSCDPDSWTMRFDIADTGIGMSSEQLETVAGCDAFVQADTSMTRRFGGTGLGLRISQALCGMLGGGLAVDSVEGEGSTFTVTVGTGQLDGVAMLSPEEASR